MSQHVHIGIDVSKQSFDIFIKETNDYKQFTMDKASIKKAIHWIKKQSPELIVLEATGGYERLLVAELVSHQLPVAIINPRRIRDYAKATGQLAKTDKIDAGIIAQYAAVIKPSVSEILSEQQKRLKSLIHRRRQLIAIRSAEKNHQEHAAFKEISKSIQSVIDHLNQEIDAIEKSIHDHMHSDPELQEKLDIIKSVPGIGDKTAALLISDLPELGSLNRRQIAALLGVAPINRDSGQYRGKRMTGSGRKQVRTGLFMAMLSIIQHNQKLSPYYNKLVASGKRKMVALIATMRKLIVILNSMVKNKQQWNYQNT